MSLMTNTMGRVDRIRSLVRLLAAHGGTMPRAEVERWFLLPVLGERKPDGVDQTIGAARGLGLVTTEGRGEGAMVSLTGEPLLTDWPEFVDALHARLIAADDEEPTLRAYAYVVLRTDQERGTQWLALGREAISEAIDRGIRRPTDEENVFNTTRWPVWRDWMAALGLGRDLPAVSATPVFFPDATARLGRELTAIEGVLGRDREIVAQDFLSALAQRMPYLDGGAIYEAVTVNANFRLPQHLSFVLSHALRELHDDGRLVLRWHGDSGNSLTLAPDAFHTLAAVTTVTLSPTVAAISR